MKSGRATRALLALPPALLLGLGRCASPAEVPHTKPARVEQSSPAGDRPRVILTAEAEQRLGIETVVAQARTLDRTRSLGGEVVVSPGGEIVVTSPVAGVVLGAVAGAFPRPGTRVRRSARLFRLLALPAGDLLAAESDLARAEAAQELAASRAERAARLLENGAGSVRQVEDARAERIAAEAALRVAQARRDLLRGGDLETVAASIAPMSIAAPVEGVIQWVRVAAGQTVASGTALAQVSRQDPLWVRVPVYAGDLPSYDGAKGARVVGLSEPPGGTGRVARPVPAPPAADPGAASVDLFFELPNPDGLFLPGQAVRATLALRGEESGLIVPARAVLYDAQGQAWVYERTAPQVFERRRVAVEAHVGDDVRITSGLTPGAEIVVAGATELYGTEFGEKATAAPSVPAEH